MAGSIGPGPSYSLPPTIGYEKHDVRKQRMPQYSFGIRPTLKDKTVTPGPGINVQNLTRYGQARTYAFSMASRNDIKAKRFGPGPANYDLSKKPYVSSTSPPAYSFGRRGNLRSKQFTPGPNAYGIKDKFVKPSAPAYSMGVRTNLKGTAGSPGPANYNPGQLNVILPAAPKYSMTPRTKFSAKGFGPGANHYNRMYYRPGNKAPSYSFGLRHSPKAPPMVVPCDNL